MKMTLAQLRIFVLTAKWQNVSLAAEKAFISQAAASMRLSQLEAHLGKALFDREGKRLILNSLGKQLLPKANDLIERAAEFEHAAMEADRLSGQLHIGASTTIANYILPGKLNEFLKQYPGVNLEVTALNTKQCIEQLLNFEIDIALVEGVYLHPKITFKPWLKDRLHVFCHPRHPLTKKNNIKLNELSAYTWVLREAASGTRQVLESALQHSPVDLPNLIVMNSSQAIQAFIKHNPFALACLSEAVIADDLAAKKLVALDIKSWKLERYFYQACYQDKSDGSLLQQLERQLWQGEII